jgi:hypothetical protein
MTFQQTMVPLWLPIGVTLVICCLALIAVQVGRPRISLGPSNRDLS